MNFAENSPDGARPALRPTGAAAGSEHRSPAPAVDHRDDWHGRSGERGRGEPDAHERGGVELQIGELVVHGYSESARERIAVSLERELGRLLRQQDPDGLKSTTGTIELDGGAFEVRPGASPEEAGVQIARAILLGVRRG